MIGYKWLRMGAILTLVFAGVVFFYWCIKPSEEVFPKAGIVTYEELDEIRDLALDRSYDYEEVLDNIVNKIDEIEERMKTDWEIQKEENAEKEQERMNEQFW